LKKYIREKPKGQSRMNNPETLARLGKQNTGKTKKNKNKNKKNTTQETKKTSNNRPNQITGVNPGACER
jgi:hypothetical protein